MKKLIRILALVFSITALIYSQEYTPDINTVALYHFNETTGTTISDTSSNGNNGIASGTEIVDGRFGQARHILTQTDYIEIPDAPTIDLSSAEGLTIEAWIKLDTLSYGYIFNKMGPGYTEDDEWSVVVIEDGTLQFSFNSPSTYTTFGSKNKITDSTWYHIAFVWDRNIAKGLIYINGILDTMVNTSVTSIQNTTIPIRMGKPTHSLPGFLGSIDEVRISRVARQSWELNCGLIAYYPFNGNVNDESGNGYNGTSYGAVTWQNDRFNFPNKAISFNRVDSYVDLPKLPIGNSNQDKSFCGWIKLKDLTHDGNIIGQGQDGTHRWHIQFSSSEINVYQQAGTDNSPFKIPVKLDTNYHFIAVVSSDSYPVNQKVKVYLDGSIIGSISSRALYLMDCGFAIGKMMNEQGYWEMASHTVDDIRIYDRALSDNEITGLYRNYRQHIFSIKDIPNDQGGKVRIQWNKIYLDVAGATPQITSYGVWRKIPAGLVVSKRPPSTMAIMNDTLGVLYDYLGTVMATQSPSYNFVAQTLYDSSESGNNDEQYLITAHSSDPNDYYISDVVSGHSVDNLAPVSVSNLISTVVNNNQIALTWDPNLTDRDFKRYEIYRSTIDGFTPDLSTKIGQATEPSFIDVTPIGGERNYFRLIGVDVHGNRSNPSLQTSIMTPATVQYTVNNKWNIVSVGLTASDYSKSVIYPTAVSNAFSYDNGYITATTLTNGAAYWLKFDGEQSVGMTGFIRMTDTIQLISGWNMIGSISSSVPVTTITSEPSGIVTSQFFGYSSGYSPAIAIEPGKGYWVKVAQAGKLILSSSATMSAVNKIHIVPTNDLPPSPPEGEINSNNSIIPSEFALSQNYPNPFNPLTVIRYQLSADSWVTLKVYNTIGEEVAVLINGMQDAGFKSVEFDASKMPSGLYYYRLQAGTYSDVKKLVLLK